MKASKLIILSLLTSSFLFAVPPSVGEIEKQIVIPKVVTEKEAKEANVIPSINPEALQEPMVEEGGKQIMVKHFKLKGALHVSEEKLRSRIGSYEGKSHTFSELQKITSLITKAYREEGYFVARAYIPKQDVKEGILEIAIIEGNYGVFKLRNASLVNNESIQGILDAVKKSTVVSTNTLERAMLLINDTPGAKVTAADVMPGSKVGTSDFTITAEATNPYTAYMIADNYGSIYTGRYRLNLGLSANSPLGYGDKLGMNGVISTATDLKNGKVYYNVPLMSNGLRAGMSVSKTTYSLAQEYASLDAFGNSVSLEATLSYPVVRTTQETLNLDFAYVHKKMKDEIQSTSTLTQKDSDAINIGMSYHKNHLIFGLNSSTTSNMTVTYGALDAPENQETDGSFAKVVGSLETMLAFDAHYALLASVRFQKSLKDKNLDGSEDFSLGGAYGVRAFPDGEHSAENGYIVGAELLYTLPEYEGIHHKASLFADTGYASMQNDNGTLESRQLSDIGIGYQASYKAFFAKAQLARVIGGEKSITEDKDTTRALVQIGWIY